MHILLIHQAFAALDEPGGTRHHELARSLVQRGHRLTIIASPISYLTGAKRSDQHAFIVRTELEPGIQLLRCNTYHALHRSFVHRVISFIGFMLSSFIAGLQVRKVDLVWGTSPPIFQGVTAWLLARLKRVPFLFEVRDLWPEFAIAVGVLRNRTLIRLSLWLEGFLYRHADRVVINSPGFREHVSRRGARRVELVPNGADPSMFDPDDHGETFRSLHHLTDKYVVMYAGAHGMSNDLGVLLESARLLADDPRIQVVFLGDGKEKPALQAQAVALRLNNVSFIPSVPKDEITSALAAADTGVAILKPVDAYKTTYPNKVFDYMCAGRPVLLAIDGVIREVVQTANCGIYTPPGDPAALAQAVRTLAADPARSREVGLNGRRYVEVHFNRPVLAENLALIMEAMLRK
jgi:glycosyltransferase involved in cell wall biosynthesis